MLAAATILPQNMHASLSAIGISQPPLPYAFDALEPFISASLLKRHHLVHHQTHVAEMDSPLMPRQDLIESLALRLHWINMRLMNLRTATQHSGGARMLAARLCMIRDLVRKHGGGHVNHSLFWRWLASPGSSPRTPAGDLANAFEASFGGFSGFQSRFTSAALSVEGNGWAWLVLRKDHSPAIMTTRTEDNPMMRSVVPDEQLGIPILGIDMAFHAYKHQYQDDCQAYVKAWWQVVNWNQVMIDYHSFASYSHLLQPPLHDPLWGGALSQDAECKSGTMLGKHAAKGIDESQSRPGLQRPRQRCVQRQ